MTTPGADARTVDVAGLREALAAATPGPWLAWDAPDVTAIAAAAEFTPSGTPVNPRAWVVDGASGLTRADAALIVAAVNAAPALLAEVERRRAQEERLRGMAEELYAEAAETTRVGRTFREANRWAGAASQDAKAWAQNDAATRLLAVLDAQEADPASEGDACPDDPDGLHHAGCGCETDR